MGAEFEQLLNGNLLLQISVCTTCSSGSSLQQDVQRLNVFFEHAAFACLYVQARNTDMEKTINGGACGTPAPGSTPGPRGTPDRMRLSVLRLCVQERAVYTMSCRCAEFQGVWRRWSRVGSHSSSYTKILDFDSKGA